MLEHSPKIIAGAGKAAHLGGGLAAYEALLRRNIDTIREAYT